jgi:hypothetical protein
LQLGLTLRKPGEKRAERGRRAFGMLVIVEVHARVDVPADQHDLVPGLQHRPERMLIIILGIDDERRPPGLLHAPAILPRAEQRSVGFLFCFGHGTRTHQGQESSRP